MVLWESNLESKIKGFQKNISLFLGFDANGTQKDAEPTLVPLVAAGKFGHKKIVEHLINNGADPLRCEFPAKQNFFQSAAQHRHIEVIDFFPFIFISLIDHLDWTAFLRI